MGPRGEPQHVAHHGVDVHVGQAAVAGAAPEGRPARGQERVHAGQGVVIAVVPHCSGAEHTVTVTAPAAQPLLPSPPPPPPKHLCSPHNVRAAVGPTAERRQSSFPLPPNPTSLFPYWPFPVVLPPINLFSFQCLTLPVFPFPFFMPKLKRRLPFHNESVDRMQILTPQILESHLSLQSGYFNYLLKNQAPFP